ncbi:MULTISPECIES: HTTM domain-containing protein [Flavobacteriaceae]|uniref:HTTM domain-containing protein n=1 Tax=Euzebyella saccharophila TaxID=679664 RepID=A0ABV8K039_9FLAO|nr:MULTISPECIES: HTTM domain-containing protein [Flavobacteriaceae]PIB37670.1 deoxyribonuclease HsdR [Maribacter sp. 4G9]|tara:strand:+ start:74931 stop:76295 length:1365 start_codon:yes stop_codon:yes gene_type:complete
MVSRINAYRNKTTDAAPLAAFRILFGLMMFVGIVRFWSYGWIDKFYIQPKFFFSYYGFEWVRPLGGYTYLLFFICGIAAICVALGYRYRIAIILFFLSFTYIELMDKTTYLNHYYFISCLSFLMIFLPANAYFSLDAHRDRDKAYGQVPRWTVDAIKLLIALVYLYAGLAKLNSDWLIRAMPLKIWLPAQYDLPLLGNLMQREWLHYAFSWGGAAYDLAIPFLLFYKPTRWSAFALVVFFHLMTRILFPIGMFPYVMIVSALVFFDAGVHHKILKTLSTIFRIKKEKADARIRNKTYRNKTRTPMLIVGLFIAFQLLFPWRYLLYKNELFWTEEGYRFSWRVMLMEKAGYAQFKIVDKKKEAAFLVDNTDFLSTFQEKQMSTQPDFILQYAHFLGKHFTAQGHKNVAVYVESYVALNGRLSQPYIDPKVNLLEQEESFGAKDWILEFKDEIKGF